MRVGILTFHECFNPGAYLQAMGTVSLLREMGHTPVIIDYKLAQYRFSLVSILRKYPKLLFRPRSVWELHGRNRAFQKAQIYFDRTPKLLTHEALAGERFDAVVIGADIVWDYMTPERGKDPAYFGAYINAAKKIAFATSCGFISSECKPPDFVISGIKSLQSVSVRDANTQHLVRCHANRDAVIICDPAFHLDMGQWVVAPVEKQPYLLVYAMDSYLSSDLIRQTKEYAKKHGLKTIAVCYRQKWTDKNRICIGPLEWLGYIQNAAAVVTNTFHGTIFSVKAGVPFVAELNDAIRLKTAAMIEKLSIEGRFFDGKTPVDEILDRAWDVEGIHAKIDAWRNEARLFLAHSLRD